MFEPLTRIAVTVVRKIFRTVIRQQSVFLTVFRITVSNRFLGRNIQKRVCSRVAVCTIAVYAFFCYIPAVIIVIQCYCIIVDVILADKSVESVVLVRRK